MSLIHDVSLARRYTIALVGRWVWVSDHAHACYNAVTPLGLGCHHRKCTAFHAHLLIAIYPALHRFTLINNPKTASACRVCNRFAKHLARLYGRRSIPQKLPCLLFLAKV